MIQQDAFMEDTVAPLRASNPALLYLHPGLRKVQLQGRGYGYVASRAIRKGELLLKEKPFAWSAGIDPSKPDLKAGVEWLLETGAVDELPCAEGDYDSRRHRAEAVALTCAYMNATPCRNGEYIAMLLRASSGFNHSCWPNAGAYSRQRNFADAADCSKRPLCTFAIEDIVPGEEVCISYLGEAEHLLVAEDRQALLKKWGFVCNCQRCAGGRPMDKRLRGFSMTSESELDMRRQVSQANAEFRSLFDSSSEDFKPPCNPESHVQKLSAFRKEYNFLDPAHTAMQRVRNELLHWLLISDSAGVISRERALAAAVLLIELMRVEHDLLPTMSSAKATTFARFHRVLLHIPPEEAMLVEQDADADGVGTTHQRALWLHDPEEAQFLRLKPPKNPLPEQPLAAPRPRTGPMAHLGAACCPCSGRGVATSAVRARCPPHWNHRRCGSRARRAPPSAVEDDQMPPLLPDVSQAAASVVDTTEDHLASLQEAYAEWSAPIGRGKQRETESLVSPSKRGPRQASWFKFRC